MRFGEFLVAKNMLGEADIEQALETQRQTRKLIGMLAVECGFISRFDNIRVILCRHKNEQSYGEIAVAKGLLTREQVEDLLLLQNESQMPLGKILQAETSISRFDLVMALKEYVETCRD
ncbi:MAG: hypothetical protein OEL55_03430 [Desulfobulbaceae bacterium]|nr:hypothetical protein [Desulfobulbaceae bacterium]